MPPAPNTTIDFNGSRVRPWLNAFENPTLYLSAFYTLPLINEEGSLTWTYVTTASGQEQLLYNTVAAGDTGGTVGLDCQHFDIIKNAIQWICEISKGSTQNLLFPSLDYSLFRWCFQCSNSRIGCVGLFLFLKTNEHMAWFFRVPAAPDVKEEPCTHSPSVNQPSGSISSHKGPCTTLRRKMLLKMADVLYLRVIL